MDGGLALVFVVLLAGDAYSVSWGGNWNDNLDVGLPPRC